MLDEMSKKWLLSQVKHKVSANAANAFWDIAFKFIPSVQEQRHKKVPKYSHQRRKMNQSYCPPIHLEFTLRDKKDGGIVKVKGSTAPTKAYENNPEYEKLYEVAYVKVYPLISEIK